MKVGEWIDAYPTTPLTVGPKTPLEAIVERLLSHPERHDVYVVSDEGRLLRRLSRKRILRMEIAEHRPARTRRQLMEQVAGGAARERMDSHFPRTEPGEDLDEVLHRQVEQEVEDRPAPWWTPRGVWWAP